MNQKEEQEDLAGKIIKSIETESAPNGFLMVDDTGTIVLANSQIEKIFGYYQRELIGEPTVYYA